MNAARTIVIKRRFGRPHALGTGLPLLQKLDFSVLSRSKALKDANKITQTSQNLMNSNRKLEKDDEHHVLFSDEISPSSFKSYKKSKNKLKPPGNATAASQSESLEWNDNPDAIFSDELEVRWRTKKVAKGRNSASPKSSMDNGDKQAASATRKGKTKSSKKQATNSGHGTPIPHPVDFETLMTELLRLKMEVFGITSPFREHQGEAMASAAQNRHVLCVVPTGSGKSLIYQIPALLNPPLAASTGPTIVISPLKALIDDQAKSLTSHPQIKVGILHGDISKQDQQLATWNFANLDFVFTTPEQLHRKDVLEAMSRTPPRRFVFDEAHCIFEWGESFRPKYKSACALTRSKFPSVPWTLLTATAPSNVREYLVGLIGEDNRQMIDVYVAQDGIRDNLDYAILSKPKVFEDALKLVGKYLETSTCAIVYCQTRDDCDAVASGLQTFFPLGHIATYHAGMSAPSKNAQMAQWKMGLAKIMVATTAFGMGVHHNSVRNIVHFSMPLSLSNYIQQCGRAGRDGGPAECIMLYDAKGAVTARHIAQETGSTEEVDEMISFSKSNGCIKKMLRTKLSGENLDVMVKCKDNCKCRRNSSFQPVEKTIWRGVIT